MKQFFSPKNRALLAELVRTDFKLRYQGSVLGYTWSLLRPLLLFLILYVVFVKFLRIGGGIPHYPIYLLLGIVLWNFFAEMTSQSLSSIVARGDLVRKIRIPRWIIVVSSSLSSLINLFLNLAIVVVFMFINRVDLLATSLWFPLILVQVYIFALGLSLLLAAAFVKYRDMSYIWEVCLQAGFYLTPIIYPISLITNQSFQKLLLVNPMATAIQDARNALVTNQTVTLPKVTDNIFLVLLPYIISIVVLVVGILYFKRQAKYFAEDL